MLHLFLGKETCNSDHFLVKATLKGYERSLGRSVNQKLPITISILGQLMSNPNPSESGFLAALSVGFFSVLRKSNLVPPSLSEFRPNRHLSRACFSFKDSGVLITVSETKTIQFQQGPLTIPLVYNSNTSICPVLMSQLHFNKFPTLSQDTPAFWYTANGSPTPITHKVFIAWLKTKLQHLGYDPSKYSGHSLRRGGATYAHLVGASVELIQVMGDWASLAVLSYLTRPLEQREEVARLMSGASQ